MQPQYRRQAWLAAWAAASALALTACGQEVHNAEMGQPYQTGAVTESPAPTGAELQPSAVDTRTMGAAPAAMTGDERVTGEVKSALSADSDLGALKIDVHTQDGQVTLRGSAPDPAAKERAGDLVKAIQGVRSVDNQLTLG